VTPMCPTPARTYGSIRTRSPVRRELNSAIPVSALWRVQVWRYSTAICRRTFSSPRQLQFGLKLVFWVCH